MYEYGIVAFESCVVIEKSLNDTITSLVNNKNLLVGYLLLTTNLSIPV